MTNFEKLYNEVIKKSLVDKFGYTNSHEIPKLTKIVLNMGVGDAVTDQEETDQRRRGNGHDRRPEAGYHQSPQIYRYLQGKRRNADRLQGNSEKRKNVRIPGKTG